MMSGSFTIEPSILPTRTTQLVQAASVTDSKRHQRLKRCSSRSPGPTMPSAPSAAPLHLVICLERGAVAYGPADATATCCLSGLPWGRNLYPHTYPISTENPVGIPTGSPYPQNPKILHTHIRTLSSHYKRPILICCLSH